jgi:hypothetical protein
MGDERHPNEMQTPDHTRLQLAAVAQAVIAVVIAFGVPITDQQSIALVALAGVIAAALVTADAAIRRERARNADKLRPHVEVTQTAQAAGRQTTTSVSAPVEDDGAVSYAHMMELLAAVEKIRDALQPPVPVRSGERMSVVSPS